MIISPLTYFYRKKYRQRGLTLLETIIGVALVFIIAAALYRGYIAVLATLDASRQKNAAVAIANEAFEIARNTPYDEVGVVGGVPAGVIPQYRTMTRDNLTFLLFTTVRNIDDPFDGTIGGDPNDSTPADYKLVSFTITCTTCATPLTHTFTGRVAPPSLEMTGSNGALFMQAIDANGIDVANANVHVTNASTTPPIDFVDTTDSNGVLKLIDVPPGDNVYRIEVTKSGYSLDRTYAPTQENPNPVKLDATVATGQVTQTTFAIDRVSTLAISSVTENCSAIGNINFTLTGAKLIGTQPDVLKYSETHTTDSGGNKTLSTLEWDTYDMTWSNENYDVAGTIPTLPLLLLPNTTSDFFIVVQPTNPSALLVTVEDASSLLPLAESNITISGGFGSTTQTTGRGSFRQTDWSGGGGQEEFGDFTRYYTQDGNIADSTPAGELRLIETATSTYATSGWLTSSTFDTGSTSEFYTIGWSPIDQPPDTGPESIRFQIATATTSAPVKWIFLGPDGTTNSYYTTSGEDINPIHSGDRFLRYRAYLQTASTTFTPNISDITLTYASACVPPGQTFFGGLTNGTYTLSVTKNGYLPYSQPVSISIPWQEIIVLLEPEP